MKKVILIIGGTSGIGKGLAKIYACEGHQIIITGRNIEKAISLSDSFPSQITFYQHDISKNSSLEEIFQQHNKIDIAIVSAGISLINEAYSWEKENDMIQCNVNAVANIYHQLFGFFQKQSSGHLVGITSVAAVKGNRSQPAYSASKVFQRNYLQALRCKSVNEKLNIDITDICPGFVETPINEGEKLFWAASTEKACKQIYEAITKKKKQAFITKRWALIYYIFKFLPNWVIEKM